MMRGRVPFFRMKEMKENKRLRKAEVEYDYRDLLTYRALVFSNTLGKGAMRF